MYLNNDKPGFIQKNLWFSFGIIAFLKLVQLIFANLTFYYQVVEWFSIYFVIRHEAKEAVKNIINIDEADRRKRIEAFNNTEIQIK